MGGGGGNPGADARAQEAERQGRIQAATDQINNIFNGAVRSTGQRTLPGEMLRPSSEGRMVDMATGDASNLQYVAGEGAVYAPDRVEEFDVWSPNPAGNPREGLYKDQRSAVFDLNSAEVGRQGVEAERATRFGLARSGLAGGSVDIDAKADLNRRTNEGLLRAGGIADQSAADLRVADERTRSNLISMAQSGVDTGSAAQMALGGLKANADSVASQRSGATVGNLFDDISQAYMMNQVQQGRAANPYGEQPYGVNSTRRGYSGTGSR